MHRLRLEYMMIGELGCSLQYVYSVVFTLQDLFFLPRKDWTFSLPLPHSPSPLPPFLSPLSLHLSLPLPFFRKREGEGEGENQRGEESGKEEVEYSSVRFNHFVISVPSKRERFAPS